MEQIAKALALKLELDTLRPIDQEREAIIMQKLRLDWDYHSNHLEGNSLTYGETKALILFGITAQGKPLHDHLEITGHDEAIKWVTEIVHGDYPINESFIRQLHVLLLKEPYEKPAITPDGKETTRRIEVGKYKSVPNHVKTRTGEVFRFATPEETPLLMGELIEWYRQKREEQDVNAIILAAEFHYKFIRIHPFDDGNGRLARILMNFILMQYGFPPAIIKTEDKSNYFAALQQADSGIYEPFFNYIAANLVRSLEIMIAGAKGERIEEPDDLEKEIALLEHKLKTIGEKSKLRKSYKVICNVFDESIVPLYHALLGVSEKFTRFYTENKSFIGIQLGRQNFPKITSDISKARDLIGEATQNINLEFTFSRFNRTGFGEFDFPSIIEIDFNETTYVVSTSIKTINFSYEEKLTERQIDELVQGEARHHMDFITQKLKEVQNKTN